MPSHTVPNIHLCIVQSLRNLRKKNQNYNTHWMVAVGDSHGRVRPEPMQKKPTKFSWWKSVKIRNDNFCSVKRDILDRSKFKCICLSFNEITTPFSVNAQLLFCSTVWVLSSKTFPFHFKFPKGIISWCERRELHICSKLSTKLLDYKNSQWFLK